MKIFRIAFLLFIIPAVQVAYAQHAVNRVKFFTDTAVVNAALTFNMGKVQSKRDKEGMVFPATFSCKLDNDVNVNDHISVEVRGHFRRAYCYLPPLYLTFNKDSTALFHHLKTLKLVGSCRPTNEFEQYLLKEFVCYKIYNLITDKSFRVRLLKVDYRDSSGKKSTISQHAFLMEDIKELAKRNDYSVWKIDKVGTEATNRSQMTIVAIFEYMIGNTDWSVPNNHNIRLIRPNNDSLARPYVVPYDFDGSGLVNTGYIVPDERMGIETVRDRAYRGFPRSMDELNEALDIFNKQKANVYALINDFNLLTPKTKNEMTKYLDEFYTSINKPAFVKQAFITNARTE